MQSKETPSQREGRIRVAASLARLGIIDPPITVPEGHKAPDDLALAVRTLRTMGRLPDAPGPDMIGELNFDGSIRPVRGVFPALLDGKGDAIGSLRQEGEAQHAARITGRRVMVADSLRDVIGHLSGERALPVASGPAWTPAPPMVPYPHELPAELRPLAERMAEHPRTLVTGWPGSGRTMAARAVTGILPWLTLPEAIEASRVHSVAGLAPGSGMLQSRPFRAPHHTVSEAAMISTAGRPGEVGLATHGVLLLDEITEYRKAVLAATRRALDSGHVARVVCLANPCPCGWHMGPRACRCTEAEIKRFRGRLDEIKALLGLVEVT